MEYICPMIKVDWHVAGALLILSSGRLVNDQICRHRICKFLQSMGSKGLLPWPIRRRIILTKYKPITNQAEWDSHLPWEKYKTKFCEEGASDKYKKTRCLPFLGLDLPMYVNKSPTHLVTHSLYRLPKISACDSSFTEDRGVRVTSC